MNRTKQKQQSIDDDIDSSSSSFSSQPIDDPDG